MKIVLTFLILSIAVNTSIILSPTREVTIFPDIVLPTTSQRSTQYNATISNTTISNTTNSDFQNSHLSYAVKGADNTTSDRINIDSEVSSLEGQNQTMTNSSQNGQKRIFKKIAAVLNQINYYQSPGLFLSRFEIFILLIGLFCGWFSCSVCFLPKRKQLLQLTHKCKQINSCVRKIFAVDSEESTGKTKESKRKRKNTTQTDY